MKKLVIRLFLLALLGAGAYGAYRLVQQMPQRQQQIATTPVRRGDVVVRSFARGELRAVRSVTLTAPNLFGSIQVTRLAPLGSFARDKDLIVEFDDSEVQSRLEEKQLELEQIDEQIKKAKADLAIRNNQDQVELLRTRYSVRRSELEVKKNELISPIDAKKNELNLEESKRRLKQLESDIKSRQEQALAEIAVLLEKKNKSNLEMAREKQRLNQVKLLSPMSGLVAVKQNRTGNFFFGQTLPDIREGDQLQPGAPVADVLDLSELEVVGKVGELDRANLREGQDVNIRLDAIPNKTFSGNIKSMSGTAVANIFSSDPGKKFDVVFSLNMKELLSALGAKPEQVQRILSQAERNSHRPANAAPPAMNPAQIVKASAPVPGPAGGPGPQGGMRIPGGTGTPFTAAELASAKLPPAPEDDNQLEVLLRPGLLVDVEIIIDRIPNAIHVPMQAVFEKDGKPMVYVKNGNRFEERVIRPAKRSETTMVVAEGLKPGELVAMADPNATGKKKDGNKQGGAGPMGGMPAGGRGGK